MLIDPDANYIREAEQLYARPAHPVFGLVPPEFNHWITKYYQKIGSPQVNQHNIWYVYKLPLQRFESNAPVLETLHLESFHESFHDDCDVFVQEVQNALQVEIHTEIQDLVPLAYEEEAGYMGRARDGLGPDIEEEDLADGIANFPSDEETGDGEE